MNKLFKKLDRRFFIPAAFVLVLAVSFVIAGNWPTVVYFKGKLLATYYWQSKVLGASVFRLPVIYHRQEHSLSCEIAALKMALNGVGITVPEGELLNQLAFDPTPRGRNLWGDPFTGFVGDIDGKMGVTGYGVYWDPIKDVAGRYTYAEVVQNAIPQDLAKHLIAGRPIVWWGYFGRGRKLGWETPDGKQINAVYGEHARTIIGFTGSEDDPTGFILMDPIYGELYWDTEKLLKNSENFGNSGVAVYPRESLFSLE